MPVNNFLSVICEKKDADIKKKALDFCSCVIHLILILVNIRPFFINIKNQILENFLNFYLKF